MRYPIGAHVKVREDLVSGNAYYMDDKRTRDSFVSKMCVYRGHEVVIERYQEKKYKLATPYGTPIPYYWTDEMLEEVVAYDLSDLPDLASLFDT